jgi:hypothetical protein
LGLAFLLVSIGHNFKDRGNCLLYYRAGHIYGSQRKRLMQHLKACETEGWTEGQIPDIATNGNYGTAFLNSYSPVVG